MKKLSFEINNAEMIQENPDSNFALLSLDFFASGDNLHDMYVSEDTLLRTAESIKNCPIVWKYDEVLDDVYTHDPDEVPCGFVPESSKIETKKLNDGRTMLSAIAYVWKRYTGPLLGLFKRDGGNKPVSVEMSVYKTQPLGNGKTELLDFRYEGITVLGSYVTPAIPLAKASVLSFAEEYEEDLEKEFSFDEIIIPNKVKYNAEKGIELHKESSGDDSSTSLAFAQYLTDNKLISPEKIKEIANYFSTHKYSKQEESDKPTSEEIDWLLWGGDYAKEWSERMLKRMDGELVTFPYKSKSEVNPALKGITPPVSLAQANAIARQAESIGSSEEKNGWAIAISSFKKTHHVEDGKWVKNKGSTAQASADSENDLKDFEYWNTINENDSTENVDEGEAENADKSEKKEMAMTEEELKNMAAEKQALEDAIKAAEDKFAEDLQKKDAEWTAKFAEVEDEKAKEGEKVAEEKKFQLEVMGKFFSEDEEAEDVKIAREELAKGEGADFGLIMNAIYTKFCKMQEIMAAFAEEKKVYMTENEELKQYKAEIEKQKKEFAINETLKDISASVYLPDEVKIELREEAEKYTLENIDTWKNLVKAKSFDFAVRQPKQVVEVGLPFGGVTKKEKSLWE